MRKILIIPFLLSLICLCFSSFADPQQKLAQLEKASGGRLGVFAINTANNQIIQYHADDIFPTGSTFKVIGVAAVLKKSMADPQIMRETIRISKEDLTSWSPVTEKKVGSEMSVLDLCAAAITHSDNTAITLLMKKIGGPEAVTSFARSIGDKSFSMDSIGNFQYTSTPSAMAKTLQEIMLGEVLAQPQREQLLTWLKNNTTGNMRIRAGVPKGWIVADKTGSGDYGTTNDIAIIWPPNEKPIVLAIYYTHPIKDASMRPDLLAAVTKSVLGEL
jgi:beta-lactamase class A